MSNSLQPYGLQLARLLCQGNSPGKNIGVGSQSFLQGIFLIQNQTWVSWIAGRFFTAWATREALWKNHNFKRHMYPDVHCSTIYNKKDMKATYMSINRWMDKEVIVPLYSRILSSWIFTGRTDAEAETPILWPLMWELTHWKIPWCCKRLKVGEEGDDRGWNSWMASLTWWTWV